MARGNGAKSGRARRIIFSGSPFLFLPLSLVGRFQHIGLGHLGGFEMSDGGQDTGKMADLPCWPGPTESASKSRSGALRLCRAHASSLSQRAYREFQFTPAQVLTAKTSPGLTDS